MFITDSSWMPLQIEHAHNAQGDETPNALHFAHGHRLQLDLYEVTVLGQLPRSGRPPLLILGGRECIDCDAPKDVYIVAPEVESAQTRSSHYYYPGTVTGEDSDQGPFYKGRLFIGRCLADHAPTAVWFQSERDSTGEWHSGVYRLLVAGDSVAGQFLHPKPGIATTLTSVGRGTCYEVPGIDNFEG